MKKRNKGGSTEWHLLKEKYILLQQVIKNYSIQLFLHK